MKSHIKKKWLAMLIGLLLVTGIAIGARQLMAAQKKQTITEAEAVTVVETMYAGNVKKIASDGDVYDIYMENTFGAYNVQLNKQTGDVLSLELVKKFAGTKDEGTKAKKKGSPDEKLPRPKIDDRQAKQIALDRIKGNGKITKIEQKNEKGRPVYTVHGKGAEGQIELTIDGNTGDVLFYSTEQNDREGQSRHNEKATPKNKISPEKAKQIALSKVKGVIDDIELEESDGSYVYEIDIETKGKEATVIVQAYTGEILSVTFEEDDDDADD